MPRHSRVGVLVLYFIGCIIYTWQDSLNIFQHKYYMLSKGKNLNRLGPNQRKVLLLLAGGVGLAISGSPQKYFGVIKSVSDEWGKIDAQVLRRTVKSLYQSKLVEERVHENGSITIILSDRGRKQALTYNIETMEIKKPAAWDGQWRMVLFDIPNNRKKEREAVRSTLKRLGFQNYQKSAFIFPYECQKELDYVIEFFRIRPYVRYLTVLSLDDEIKFKNDFGLI